MLKNKVQGSAEVVRSGKNNQFISVEVKGSLMCSLSCQPPTNTSVEFAGFMRYVHTHCHFCVCIS